MPWASVTLKPGLNVEITPTANTTGYTATQLVRFKAGNAQKLGGWTKYYPNLIGGVPKATHAWQDLTNNKHLVIGTTTGLCDIANGTYRNIAPQTLTTNVACSFATSSGSPIVTIVDTAVNTITPYDVVFFNTPVAVGGLVLSGAYQVLSNVSTTSYTITAASNATATVSPGAGAVPTFTTISGSANVAVGLVAHGLLKGDYIVFPLSTTVGGVTIYGRYMVQSITSANIFVITASNSASSDAGPTSMNSGNAGFLYYLAVGPQSASEVYGSAKYGDGVYGLGITLSGQTGTNPTNTDWTLDNWGELLIANPEGGGIYYWGPNSGYQNCSLIATGPLFNTGAFVSIAQQMIIAYGSTVSTNIGLYQDPMMVKWCDVEDFTTWTAAIANQAGSYRIPTGSRIIGGAATAHQNLIWTDLDLWSMTYTGATFVFSFNKIGANCGLIAKHARAQLADNIYWMGTNNFFALSGNGVVPLPCPVWDAVFQDLDTTNAYKCFAGSNTSFSEVWFFYPSLSGGLGYCDKYAKFNVTEGTWDVGSLQRNTWLDTSVVGSPVALNNAGCVYAHESGTDADGSPLGYSYDTGYFYVDDGRETVFIDRIYADFKWGLYGGSENASILVTVKAVKYPGGAVSTYGPFTVTKATPFISKRIRARQIMLHIEGNDMGSFTRLGLVRVRFAPDGRGP
jgi:hypothetical protein